MAGRLKGEKAWARQQEELNAYYDERSRWFAVDSDGNRLNQGDKVVTFRGEEMEFDRVSDYPTGSKSGKVLVTDPKVAEGNWRRSREFYPSVINVELRREPTGN